MIKGKTPEEIRKTFNIKNDFSPEEEEQIRKENEWCEEKQKNILGLLYSLKSFSVLTDINMTFTRSKKIFLF